MALRMRDRSKMQMMSITSLLLFLLMLAEFFSFIIIEINYNSLFQATAVATSSTNIGGGIEAAAPIFANASASRALSVLAYYESTPSLRQDNFITNFSAFISDLMTNGTVPNVPVGSSAANVLGARMGGLTFNSYNATLLAKYNGTLSFISINETSPVVSQQSPYSISVSYTEDLRVNSSSGVYNYDIPVTATVPLNGTQDIYYAEEGRYRQVDFTGLGNLTSLIGGVYAMNGSAAGFAYGPIFKLPAGSSSCAAVPNNKFIIAIQDARTLGGSCYNNYAGLITYHLSSVPNVPYLIYNGDVGIPGGAPDIISGLKNGSEVLLYGPEYALFSEVNLQNVVYNGSYIASPYAPSYTERVAGNPYLQSPNGVFTFSGYGSQGAYLNGIGGNYISVSNLNVNTQGGGYNTVSFWMLWNGGQSEMPFGFTNYDLFTYYGCFGFNTGSSEVYGINNASLAGRWVYVTAEFYNGAEQGRSRLYIDGKEQALQLCGGNFGSGTASKTAEISSWPNGQGYPFNGEISDFQVYNTLLNPQQVFQLYSGGREGIPVSNAGLIAWLPLNGNSNDTAGAGATTAAYGVSYATAAQGEPTSEVANFNGYSSFLNISNSQSLNPSYLTMTAWVNISSYYPTCINYPEIIINKENEYEMGIGCNWNSGYNGKLLAAMRTNGGNWNWYGEGATQLVPLNSMAFVAVSWDGNNENFYIDGQQVDTVNINSGSPTYITSETSCLRIGARDCGSGAVYGFFNGMISDAQIYGTALSQTQLETLYSAGPKGGPLNGAGLRGWWPLNGNGADYSGMNNNANAAPGVTYNTSIGSARDSIFPWSLHDNAYPIPGLLSCTNAPSCYNASLANIYAGTLPLASGSYLQPAKFNGVTSYISIGNSTSLNIPYSMTITAWVNEQGLPGYPYPAIVSKGGADVSNYYFGTWQDSNEIYFTFYNGGWQDVQSGLDITPGEWNFVAVTVNTLVSPRGREYFYVNGQQSSAQYTHPHTPLITDTNPLWIGQSGNGAAGGAQNFNGSIADVQIYNTDLGSSQISQIYGEGIMGAPVQLQNLVGWWPLNGNCRDYSNNGNGCVSSDNVTYPMAGGIFVNGTSAAVAYGNEWQALGFGRPPT